MRLRASFWTWKILNGKLEPDIMPTAYLMLDGRCVYDCAYCTHARTSTTPSRFLSRVTWREIDPKSLASLSVFKRVCVQVVNYVGAFGDTLELVDRIRKLADGVLLSVSIRVVSTEEIDELMSSGVDDLGIAIDVADPELHKRYRGWPLSHTLELIDYAAQRYPGRITAHVIVGLGESDEQLYELFRYLRDRGVRVALFAFTPVPGTQLSRLAPPSLERYRKIQLLRYLLHELRADPVVSFDRTGALVDIEVPEIGRRKLEGAFATSGCPLCTRPYYNDRPIQKELYNDHHLVPTDEPAAKPH